MSPITTHVLDTSLGRPAVGMVVFLELHTGQEEWTELAYGTTNTEGRITNLLPDDHRLTDGYYRLRFLTGDYFRSMGGKGFFPEVQVVVDLDGNGGHYHIPLLLSPFGYSTYRGS